MTMRTSIAAMAAAAFLASAGTALADSNISFCNKTGSTVFTALAYVPPSTQKWTLAAWQTIPAGACKSVATLRTGLFYYYAEKEGRKFNWPARAGVDKTFCVPSRAVTRVLEGRTCLPGERNLGFKGTVPAAGSYTINLNS